MHSFIIPLVKSQSADLTDVNNYRAIAVSILLGLCLSYSRVSLLTTSLLPLLPTSTSLGLNSATQLACAPVFSNGQLITMLVVAAMYSYAL